MRRWHRLAAIPAGVFLFFIALTGVLLHLDMMRVGQHPPGHEPAHPEAVQRIPSDAELAAMIARIGDAARGQNKVPIHVIQLSLTGSRPTLTAGAGGPPGSAQIKLDALTGQPIVDPPAPRDFHYILQDLHAGYFFGWPGRIISVLCGVSLIVLSLTGLQVWWGLRRRRRKPQLWWK